MTWTTLISWAWCALAQAQEAPATPEGPAFTVVDDGVVRREGTAEPDPAVADALASLQNLRQASLLSASPDGQTLLIGTRFGETQQVHRVLAPGGARTQLTFRDEPVTAAVLVPDGSGDIVFRADRGGDEQFQLFRQGPTGPARLLTDGAHRHEDFVFDRAGAQLAFNSNARNGRDVDLWIGDGRDASRSRLLREVEGSWSPLSFSPSGRQLLALHYVSILESNLWLVDVASGEARRIAPDDQPASFDNAHFGADDQTVFLTTDRFSDHHRPYRVNLADNRWDPLAEDLSWGVSGLSPSPDGRRLLMTVNADGLDQLHLLDLKRGRREVLPTPDVLGGAGFPRDRSDLLLGSFGGPTRPTDVYGYDLKTKAWTRWTFSETAGLDPASLTAPELHRTTSFDGEEVPFFLYRPAGAGPHPVVVLFHGGPEAQYRPHLSPLIQVLVQRGVAVLAPNVRGSAGYGKRYLALDNGPLREDSVRDAGAILDWIAKQPGLDPQRVAVQGGSYGGYMVLASLVHHGARLRAGVDVVGIANFITFLEKTSPYRVDLRRVEYGDERDPEMRKIFEQISPVNNVDKIQSALFVVHGANDPRVPLAEATQIVEAVRARGLPVWSLVARNEGHGFRKKENKDLYEQLVVQFLEQHLGQTAAGAAAPAAGAPTR